MLLMQLTLSLCLVFVSATGFAARLVSTSPGLTELLFQLGVGHDIVGTGVMSWYPEAAKQIPVIGSEIIPSAERLARFHPDFVLFDTAVHSPALARALHVMHFPSVQFLITDPDKLIAESSRLLQTVYGVSTNARLDAYRHCLTLIPHPVASHRFLALAWLSPPFIFGAQTFLSTIIQRLGGINIVPVRWKVEYPQVSEEWLIRQEVDVVYFTPEDPTATNQLEKLVKRWWPTRKVTLRRLPPEFFSRSTFTPFKHLSLINSTLSYQALEDCLAAIH